MQFSKPLISFKSSSKCKSLSEWTEEGENNEKKNND